MGYRGVWVIRAMGYEGVNCISIIMSSTHVRTFQIELSLWAHSMPHTVHHTSQVYIWVGNCHFQFFGVLILSFCVTWSQIFIYFDWFTIAWPWYYILTVRCALYICALYITAMLSPYLTVEPVARSYCPYWLAIVCQGCRSMTVSTAATTGPAIAGNGSGVSGGSSCGSRYGPLQLTTLLLFCSRHLTLAFPP